MQRFMSICFINTAENYSRLYLLQQDEIRNYVQGFLQMCWTAEQIAGRTKLNKLQFPISFSTIYRTINSGILPAQFNKVLSQLFMDDWKAAEELYHRQRQ